MLPAALVVPADMVPFSGVVSEVSFSLLRRSSSVNSVFLVAASLDVNEISTKDK